MAKANRVIKTSELATRGYKFKGGLIDKGGRNVGPSAITERPPAPEPIATLQSVQSPPPASDQREPASDPSPD